MAQKLLSICIPTYNRKNKLALLLSSINKEISGLESEVEVCISDNGSPDGTRRYLEEYRKTAGFEMTFFFGDKNEGFDVNLHRVLGLGKGSYLWTIGDDDFVLPDSIKKLVELLKGIEDTKIKVVYLLRVAGDGTYDDFETKPNGTDLVTNPNSFISTIILRRSAFEALDKSLVLKGIGTTYVHRWILRLLKLSDPDTKIAYLRGVPAISSHASYSKWLLSWELFRSSKSQQYEYFLLLRHLCSVTPFPKKYFFFTLKRLGFFYLFPFFQMLCERVFRTNDRERLYFKSFFKAFGVFFGLIYFVYYALIWLVPSAAADFLLKFWIFVGKKLHLMNDVDYGKWKQLWTGTFKDTLDQSSVPVST